MILHQHCFTTNPMQGFFINDLNIIPFFILNEEAFLSKYSTFFYDLKENSW